jgi:hypothetical protein
MYVSVCVSRRLSVLLVTALVLALTPLHVAHAAGVRYAKPVASGAADCLSWTNACTLQAALTGAVSGDEIWVAAGMHKPTTAEGNQRLATFQLKNGVALYGGFAGTEMARSERNPAVNVTVLSGDIDNNDSQTPIISDLSTVTGNTSNSYHVVTGADGASLDGFTITAGYSSNVSTPHNRGGGMYNNYSSPTVTNVTFSGNATSYGGGMMNSGSNPTLTNVTFSHNAAAFGGGMENVNSSPTLTNVTFSGNSVSGGLDSAGGGMDNSSSNPVLTNVTFSGNSAEYGGGMANYSSSPSIGNTILWGNTASTDGAQVFDDGSGSPSVSDSVVQDGYVGGTNIITTTPMLGVLGNHGGATQTVPLQAGSSAIDAGNDAVCPPTDQRGVIRPQGAHCDIGAYEVDTTAPTVVSSVRADANPTTADSVDFVVTFSEAVTGVDTTGFTLTSTGTISGAIVAGVAGGPTVYTVTVNTGTGSGAVRLDVVDGDAILDLALNPLGGTGAGNGSYAGGETYDVRLYRTFLPLVVKS